jgi:release factor glutamine methyltransferase
MTILETLKLATEYLEKHKIENPRLNAELLLAEILKCKRLELYTNFDKPLKEDELEKFREYLRRRSRGEPLQYITGKVNFFGYEFIVTPDVLIPRPETELLVEEVIQSFDNNLPLKILDLCSGSGNIGIVLAKFFKNSIVHCIDVSDKAIEVGKLNSQQLKTENVVFQKLDILNDVPLEKDFDVIVSNPPYISVEKKESLQDEVKLYEPHIALFVDEELKFYRRILKIAKEILKLDGKIFFEIDHHIADDVYELMLQNGFTEIVIKKDFSNLNRIISGVKIK